MQSWKHQTTGKNKNNRKAFPFIANHLRLGCRDLVLKFTVHQAKNVRWPTRVYLGRSWRARSRPFSAKSSKWRRNEKLKDNFYKTWIRFFDKVVIGFSMMHENPSWPRELFRLVFLDVAHEAMQVVLWSEWKWWTNNQNSYHRWWSI